ncbi:MAG: hypothetical protein FWE71_09860 [Nocardioidaceae bacterium]|nr:hypothetical protein [Nocardioidaceae bacterium]MCL2611932.1 hypothetical protein [Nocardioidaceae bacterium]
MQRPRFDGTPLWPALAALGIGVLMTTAAYSLHAFTRAIALVDDAHTTED